VNKATILACALVSLLVAGGSATAASLITSSDIKNGTIKSEDIKDGYVKSSDIKNGAIKNEDIKKTAITMDRFSKSTQNKINKAGTPGAAGATGAQGPAGPQGLKGDKGDKGDAGPTLSSGNWGVQNRNTIGSPSAFLRSGPSTPAVGPIPAQAPPFGTGSLNLVVSGTPTVPDAENEKAAYGNEVDFVGDSFQDLTAVGFHLYTTVENIDAGGTDNLPSITLEVDPNKEGVDDNFASLVFFPEPIVPLRWSDYIDATTTGLWGGTGPPFTGTPCDINGTRCSFAALKAMLDDGGDPAIIATVAVSKGRDNSWQGAVDGLKINNTVYDFEETGVFER